MTRRTDVSSAITMPVQDFEWPALARSSCHAIYLQTADPDLGPASHLPLLAVSGHRPGPVLLVLAGVHGDEFEGMEAIPRIFEHVLPAQLTGTLLMVPVCNPPAYAAMSRTSPVDHLDMARVFPGDPSGSQTQQLACWITERLIRTCDFLIDLHSGGLKYRIPNLVGYVDSADEIGRRNLAGAQAFGAPVLWTHPLPVAPGRSLSAAAALRKPAIYVEATGGGKVRPNDVAWLVNGVLNVLRAHAMLAGEVPPARFEHFLVGHGNLDELIRAGTPGYFQAEVQLLEHVVAGQRLGAIYDELGQMEEIVHADRPGVVVLLRQVPRVEASDGLLAVTGATKAPPGAQAPESPAAPHIGSA
jgi:uncharacterized protein